MFPFLRWDIDLNLAALVVLGVVLVNFLTRQNLPLRANRTYRTLLLLSLATIVLDTVTAFTLTWHEQVPQVLNWVLNLAFITANSLLAPVFLRFVQIVTRNLEDRPWARAALFSPLLPVLALIAASPWTGWVIAFDSSGVYGWGPFMPLLYGIAEYFILASLVTLIVRRRRLSTRHWWVLLFFILASLGAVVLQFLVPQVLVIGFITSLSMLLLSLSLQNPEQGIDIPTGIFNRASFMTLLEMTLQSRRPFTLLALALDDFKFINNTFGITNGDTLIRLVAEALRAADPRQLVFRLGGDQFVLILEGSQDEAEGVLNRLRQRFHQPWDLNRLKVRLSACWAVLAVPQDAHTGEDIVDGLDFSLLEAKRQGKDSLVYTRDLAFKPGRRAIEVEKALRRALKHETFSIVFQPIYSVEAQRFVSLEALVRLKDEHLGSIPPDEFIPLAEKNGLIVELGAQVFRKICGLIRDLDLTRRGIEFVEINLSAVEVMEDTLAEALLGIIRETGVDPRSLNLEITETTAVNSPEALLRTMRTLGEAGISFSLDDYGTGYSTIDAITSYNYRLVKLDKSLVWSFLANPKAEIVMTHTVRMLKDLNLKIVAEGVETREQAEVLKAMGCDYLQGYYYSRPLPEEELAAFLSSPV